VAAPHSVQPQDVVDAVGTRSASMYDLCSCGRVKAKKAHVCRWCYDDKEDA
jgi:hypothetical protein